MVPRYQFCRATDSSCCKCCLSIVMDPERPSEFAPDEPIPFKLKKILASGSQGSVFLAERLDDIEPKEIAVKRAQLSIDGILQKQEAQRLDSEKSKLLKLIHPNVVRHLNGQYCPSPHMTQPATYDIVMEFCAGGTLQEAARTSVISPELLQRWIKDVLDGLHYLHSQKIVHRDIKSDNILLSHPDHQQATMKIADLGFFKQLLDNVTRRGEVSHTKGTTPFMSPEMIQAYSRNVNIGRRTDIWSLGCVIIEMITGKGLVFTATNPDGTTRVLKGTAPVMNFVGTGGRPDIPAGLPESLNNFISLCLTPDADKRPRADALLKEEFCTCDASNMQLPPRT